MKRKVKQKGNNPWRTATIILGLIILGFLAIDIYNKIEKDKEKSIEIPGIGTVPGEQMESFLRVFNTTGKFLLCNLEENNCTWIMYKLPTR